jgi:3-hydroxybutyryl-CoA dehydrogenase
MKVAMIGVGLMGSQTGCEYALAGHHVTYLARSRIRARARIDSAFDLAVQLGLSTEKDASSARAAIQVVEQIAALAEDTDLVAESIREDLELKTTVLREAAARMPRAILASNTSSLSLTRLGTAVGAAERTLGVHYWNPPLLMPPVEIIAGADTDPEVVERVRLIIEQLGKEPILVRRDVAGFIWNRLQMAILRESLWLVEQGVADPDTVDQVVRSGLARRCRYTGPFETVALGGVPAWSHAATNIFPHLSTADSPGNLERWLNRPQQELDAARHARDRGLAAELARERGDA